MSNSYLEILATTPQKNASTQSLNEQIDQLKLVAEHVGLAEAFINLLSSKNKYLERLNQSRDLQATLFRLKQIDGLLSNPNFNARLAVELMAEKKSIIDGISMPESISITEFASESAENAKLLEQLAADIKSGKISAS